MSKTQSIVCPTCKTEISIDDVLRAQIESSIKEKYEAEKQKDKAAIEAKEAELANKAAELETAKKNTDKTIADAVKEKLVESEKEIQKQAKLDAEGEQKIMMDSLKNQLTEKTNMLTESRKEQAKLLEDQQKLKDEKEAFEVEKLKQLDAERNKIIEDANKKAAEAQQNIIAAKDKQIADALKAKDELTRKLEQGSQQAQGEVAELNLEEELSKAFIYDVVEPVPKGISGADIIHKVRNATGKECGQIIWEVKNTKTWSDGWIQKLKDDQREVRTDVAIILSRALPDGITAFAPRDGVWVCDIRLAIPLAMIIREKLEAITREKGLAVGKNEKMEILYQYLTGVQFKQRIEAIVESFRAMKDDLDAEKRHFIKKWAKTEKQIEKIINNTVGMYGDFEGLVSLPKIQILELEHIEVLEEPTEE